MHLIGFKLVKYWILFFDRVGLKTKTILTKSGMKKREERGGALNEEIPSDEIQNTEWGSTNIA